MALYLVQHGKSLSKEMDPEKGLSEEGRADVARIAQVAGNYGVSVNIIQHSGKKRARQTAEIMASFLNPPNGIHRITGINPLDDVVKFADQLTFDDNQMMIGHLPFMERLTNYLITGTIDRRVLRFQNGGIVCLTPETDKTGWVIQWTLMPEIK